MKLKLNKIHHVALICSDYEKSKLFYTELLGLTVISETYRSERKSWKLDLALNGEYILELFSFPHPPERISHPESAGLRHLAFEADDLNMVITFMEKNNIFVEPVRTDENTDKQFTFIADPDNLPIEFYQK